ncbi:MAG TPA: hypothetical protein VGS22_28965 [Thermoanaerobaculia bacterium]|jgi:hypothetical protein|nr:hypothetical protein [Thermoanaerobaculia bacterium]
MGRSALCAVFLLSSVLVGSIEAATAEKHEKGEGFATVRAVALAEDVARTWPRFRFVQADQQGRVVVLRSDDLTLYSLSPGGKLLARGALEGSLEPPEGSEGIDSARLSPAGDVWVTYTPMKYLEVFRGEKSVQRVETKWLVSSIAAGDGPIVSVLPGAMDMVAPELPVLQSPPLVIRWDGKGWETWIPGTISDEPRKSGVGPMEQMRGQYGTLLLVAPNGQLWIADQYANRLRHFTASGELKDELRIASGEVTWAERSEEEYARLEKVGAKQGFAFDRKKVSSTIAKPVYRSLTLGRDGLIYLLAETQDGIALDRFDPLFPSYDRVLLRDLSLPVGPVNLVAGAHSLIVAPRLAREGLWEIPNEALLEADWRQVPDASINSTPIPVRQPNHPGEKGAP